MPNMGWGTAVAGLAQAGASLFGGGSDSTPSNQAYWQKSNAALSRSQWKWQKRAHKNRIRWMVRDAQAAGVHPLYALGAGGGPAPSPSGGIPFIGGGGEDSGFDYGAFGHGTGLVARGIEEEVEKLQLRRLKAQTAADEAAAMVSTSIAARLPLGLFSKT